MYATTFRKTEYNESLEISKFKTEYFMGTTISETPEKFSLGACM